MRNTKQAIAALCLINSSSAFALGIGDITTHSALNQVLNAKIPLVSSKNEDPTNINVDLASRETFKQAGIDRPQYLSDLKFTPVVSQNGDVTITVTSSSTIKEPFVNFILEVEWPQGRTLKEFTILLDPPITMADVTTAPVELAKSSAITAIPATNASSTSRNSQVSSPEQLASNYGPTNSSDTVWGIAKKLLTNNNTISHEQMMMALFETNPKAFYKNNINALMKGQVLQVPDSDAVNQLSTQQARAAFYEQNIQWSASARAKQVPNSSNAKIDSPSPASKEAKLTLLTPEESADNQASNTEASNATSPSATPGSSDAVTQANIALEMATTIEQENKEVKSRLSDLETQVEKLQRLIALKDDQLAQLQAKPTEATKTVPPKKPAPVVAPAEAEETEETEESMLPIYAGGGLLIALLGLFLARRRKSDDQPFPIPDDSANEKRDLFEETMSEIVVEEELPVPEESTQIESESLLSEFTPSEFENLDESLEADPLTECDVYIAYGRYQQAEDLIQKAIEEDPSNEAYKLKLLDVYYSSENSSAFEDLAKDLDYLKSSNPEMWGNISNMGADICPESVLFFSPISDSNELDDVSDSDLTDAIVETNETMLNIEDETTDELTSLDFEMPETNLEGSDISEEISLDLTDEAVSEETSSEVDNSDFDFDFDLIKPDEDSSSAADDSMDSDADTKLSLAEAYIDMLDMESAKEALDEVLESGNAEQIEKAKSLLEKL